MARASCPAATGVSEVLGHRAERRAGHDAFHGRVMVAPDLAEQIAGGVALSVLRGVGISPALRLRHRSWPVVGCSCTRFELTATVNASLPVE